MPGSSKGGAKGLSEEALEAIRFDAIGVYTGMGTHDSEGGKEQLEARRESLIARRRDLKPEGGVFSPPGVEQKFELALIDWGLGECASISARWRGDEKALVASVFAADDFISLVKESSEPDRWKNEILVTAFGWRGKQQ